ncbi:uncharacterized protein LOC119615725, partial [Lucilia sericata]
MDTLKSNKSSFSIENILEQKTSKDTNLNPATHIQIPSPSLTTTSLPSPNLDNTVTSTSLTRTPDFEQYTAFKNLTLKTANHNNNSPSSLTLASTLPQHATAAAAPALHYDHVYDPTASLFYQQVLNLQKNSAFLMPHFQAAAAAAAMANVSTAVAARGTPSVYCEPPYNQFMDCE